MATWEGNRDYIISRVNAGTATEGQQDWYDRWVASGSPDTQDGMMTWDQINAAESSQAAQDTTSSLLSSTTGALTGSLTKNDLLENPLVAETEDPFADTVAPEPTPEPEGPEQFLIIGASTAGDAQNPFLSPPEVYMGTADDLQAMYDDSKQLQEAFGSFENYLDYNRDFTASGANWVESASQVSYRPGTPEWALVNGEDYAWAPGQKEALQEQIIQDQKNAYVSAYQQWVSSEEGQSLLSQYGVNPTVYNQDGDQYKFTGTGFQKTYKFDDSFDTTGFVKGLITSVAIAGLSGNLAAALNMYAGLSPSVAEAIANGVQAVATNGGSLSTGDFLSLAAGAVGLDVPDEILSSGEWADYVGSQVLDAAIEQAKQAVRDETGVDVAWQDVDISDNIGDFQAQLPDYTQPVEEEAGGGGGGDTASESVDTTTPTDTTTPAEITEPSATDKVGGLLSDAIEQAGSSGSQGGYVYEGNGVFRDTVDGDMWYVPGAIDLEVGAVVDEGYMANSGATVYDGSQGAFDPGTETGESEDTRTDWERNRDFILNAVLNGTATAGQQEWYDKWVAAGQPDSPDGMNTTTPAETTDQTGGMVANDSVYTPPMGGTTETTDTTTDQAGGMVTNDSVYTPPMGGTDTSTDTSTNTGSGSQDGDFTFGGLPGGTTDAGGTDGGTDVGDGTGDGSGTGTGTGTGTGSGAGSGTGDGSGDGWGDAESSGGMLSGGGDFLPKWTELFAYTPFSPVKAKAIAPYMDYIKQARGMLS